MNGLTARFCATDCGTVNYLLPFIIYRETVKNGSNISMSNEGIYTSLYAVGHGRQGHDFVKGTAGREIFRDDGQKNERKD